jgi:5'-nucleotidase
MRLKIALLVGVGVATSGVVAAGEVGPPYHVMVANDDGIAAEGLEALVRALVADPSYRVTVVAPAEQQSVTSHSHVTRRDVPLVAYEPVAGAPAWSVGGTPATTVRLGLTAVLADDRPDLVVSGINMGENDGLGAWTSGTVAAAREAVLAGVPGVALSLQLDWDDPRPDFEGAARWCKPVLDAVRAHPLPPGCYLNVNVPRNIFAIRGFRLARMSLVPPSVARFEEVRSEPGVRWFRSRWRPPLEAEPGSDTAALADGWVTIVPLGLDQTAYQLFPALELLAPEVPAPPLSAAAAAGGR